MSFSNGIFSTMLVEQSRYALDVVDTSCPPTVASFSADTSSF